MNNITFHCLFEQSGTFKNTFKNNGYFAFDYDILNDYGQTDYQIDLFKEIDNEYNNLVENENNHTIFSSMTKENDFIIAFFPCTYFSAFNDLIFRMQHNEGKNQDVWTKEKIKNVIKRNMDRARYYELYLKFCYICKIKKLRSIIENPASGGVTNYLIMYSPIKCAWYEKDRSLFGDYFKKPTNFFAINFEMKEEFMFFSQAYGIKTICKDKKGCRERSEISPEYAENFYKRFLQNKI